MTEPTATNDRDRHDEWAATVQALAGRYPFPPTPNIAGQVRRRLEAGAASARHPARPAWQRPALALAILLLLLLVALSVPAVRAAVREWLQIGAVRILLTPPSTEPATTAPASSQWPRVGLTPPVNAAEAGTTATLPAATVTPPLGAPLTLAEAQVQAGFELRLPTAPPADRPPDRVYLQPLPVLSEERVVISVWDDAGRPGEPILSLYQIKSENCCLKGAWASGGAETEVGGEQAYWVEGPHPLSIDRGDNWSIVPGDVLIWAEGAFTYRLESTLSLEETVTVAESLR